MSDGRGHWWGHPAASCSPHQMAGAPTTVLGPYTGPESSHHALKLGQGEHTRHVILVFKQDPITRLKKQTQINFALRSAFYTAKNKFRYFDWSLLALYHAAIKCLCKKGNGQCISVWFKLRSTYTCLILLATFSRKSNLSTYSEWSFLDSWAV